MQEIFPPICRTMRFSAGMPGGAPKRIESEPVRERDAFAEQAVYRREGRNGGRLPEEGQSLIVWDGERKIRVLVVDDSYVFREEQVRGLSSDPDIEVVASAQDPGDAREKLLRYQPDIMTCDIDLPGTSGIAFIRELLPQYPLPVIAVSPHGESALEALQAGAVEFVAKPAFRNDAYLEDYMSQLVRKIKIAARAKVVRREERPRRIALGAETRPPAQAMDRDRLIVIGASTGGAEAIHYLLQQLPADVPGIVIAQHMPPIFTRMFAERLNRSCPQDVSEASGYDYVQPGTVLIVPGDRHASIVKAGNRFRVECHRGEPDDGPYPSIDGLFASAAEAAGERAIGILLTGAGRDGASGLLALRQSGARTIAQDEASSVVYGMPKAAYDIGAVEVRAALPDISRILLTLLS